MAAICLFFGQNNSCHVNFWIGTVYIVAVVRLADSPPPSPLSGMHLGKLRVAIKKYLAKELKEVDKLVKGVMG
ncbi:MAG: hypothetical protein HUU34_22645 [Saprospiraceae bacterium]|nr:hypothetical protein [Saprospiraceae bacterium]